MMGRKTTLELNGNGHQSGERTCGTVHSRSRCRSRVDSPAARRLCRAGSGRGTRSGVLQVERQQVERPGERLEADERLREQQVARRQAAAAVVEHRVHREPRERRVLLEHVAARSGRRKWLYWHAYSYSCDTM